jgi:hypothetical protein
MGFFGGCSNSDAEACAKLEQLATTHLDDWEKESREGQRDVDLTAEG